MKKLLGLAAALAALGACTKTTVYEDGQTEIAFQPVNYATTKVYGPVDGTAYPETEQFSIFAFHTSSPAGTGWTEGENKTLYIGNKPFKFKKDGATWSGVTPYYWPKTGSLYFAGYSPSQAGGTTITASHDAGASDPKLSIAFTQGAYAYTDGTSVPAGYKMVDLMWFDVANSATNPGTAGVPVTFRHALSYLTFKLNYAEGLSGLFSITKVTLKDVRTNETFASGTAPAWTETSVGGDIVLYQSAGGQELSTEAFVIDDVLVIPQTIPTANKTLVIEYKQKASASEPAVVQAPAKLLLTGGDGSGNTEKWLIGKHYTYTITFSAEEILIAPSVENWTDVTGGATFE